MDDTPPASTVWHTFRARDARTLIDFLVKAFGFVEKVAYEEGGIIVHAQLDWPEGGGIMRGDDRPGGSEWTRTPGAYVVTADVDALHARAVAAGPRSSKGRSTARTAAATSSPAIRRATSGRSAPTPGSRGARRSRRVPARAGS
jgi:predicted enzyme related to lactoylglutathione lyase